MAFTSAEKAQLRQVMGVSEFFKDWDGSLEPALAELEARSPDAVPRVQADLASITQIDAKILDVALNASDVAKADEVVFRDLETQLEALREQGRRLIARVAITLNWTVEKDYYSAAAGSGGLLPVG